MLKPFKPRDERDPITIGEQLGGFALIILLMFGSVFLFIVLDGVPYGVQCATAISYTGAIFVNTFFRTKRIETRHDLSAPYVLEQMPRLLRIHAAYLLCIFILETVALEIRPSMPDWWLVRHGKKDGPPFDTLCILVVMAVAISQIFISQRILGRAKREHSSQAAL